MSQPKLPKNAGPVEWVGPEHPFLPVSGLIHWVRLPREASLKKPAPVAVMLHGWGGDEGGMWVFKQVVSPEVAIITPRAPLDLGHQGYVWFDYRESRSRPDLASWQENLDKLNHFLRSLPDLYPIDPERLILIGFSQGAAMINSLVINRPQVSRGAASLSGFIPETFDLPTRADWLKNFPVFIAHGVRDEIVPLRAAQRTRDIYNQLGAEVTYGEYPIGHKTTTQGMHDLKQWVSRLGRD
jgi:phospholipase/carboxylesterase